MDPFEIIAPIFALFSAEIKQVMALKEKPICDDGVYVLRESSSCGIIREPAAIYVPRSEKSETRPIKSVGGVRFKSTEGVVIIFRAVCNIGSLFVHRRCAGGFSASPLRSCGFHAMPVVASIYHCYWSVWTDCGAVEAAVVACRETTKRRKRKSVTWSGDIL